MKNTRQIISRKPKKRGVFEYGISAARCTDMHYPYTAQSIESNKNEFISVLSLFLYCWSQNNTKEQEIKDTSVNI